ncbi:MAG: protein kinase [Actinomycetia bacterium]|nr:protein kinase [Actinomycetes bacterium]
MSISCAIAGCGGNVLSDGYCDTCGTLAASSPTRSPAGSPTVVNTSPSIAAASSPAISSTTGASRRSGSASSTGSTRGTRRSGLGAGLVEIEPTEAGDPSKAVMTDTEIAEVIEATPEQERFCKSCESEVGRSTADRPGRIRGFCSNCRTPFDFASNAPALSAGEVVAGQYEVLGPIAHGGMGWIYLGRDKAVSDRWVVLKGLLDSTDPDAAIAAVAERQFLAQIEHGNIVNIYNFVTHAGSGYIVMEYVGGESLNSKLKARRRANSGIPDPLPVAEAIAYVLGILPAFGYLHDHGLVYNDLKPANIMAVDSGVKLIDVGAVMRIDDHDAAIFGTQGFQAPEVATAGPSAQSDLFTVGRTLAVLVLNFVFHSGSYQYALPGPDTEPLFARWESLHRFLLKATAPHPDDRFQTAAEMTQQLTGVLREIVAVESGTPRPSPSHRFGPDRSAALLHDGLTAVIDQVEWRALPRPVVDPEDPAAASLIELHEIEADQALALIAEGLEADVLPDSREVHLRRARALIEAGRNDEVDPILDTIVSDDPWEWRVDWYRGLDQLARGNASVAAERFSNVWTSVPGELAPQLAVAMAAEGAGEHVRAGTLYDRVISVDPTDVSAAFGLARCRVADGDRSGAAAALGRIPRSSAAYGKAQAEVARLLAAVDADGNTMPTPDELAAAARTVERLQIDAAERATLTSEILERALVVAEKEPRSLSGVGVTLFGRPLDEPELRKGLEAAYRERARLASTDNERVALVDQANRVRPRTLL